MSHPDSVKPKVLTSASIPILETVSSFTKREFLHIPSTSSITYAAREMLRAGSTEAVVCNYTGAPVGIITERDVLYRVVAAGKDPSSTQVVDEMSTPIETVEEDDPIVEAILKMRDLGIRRLGVTRNGRLIGLVTQNSIVSGEASTLVK
jgi:CBS domain-containing protein